MEYNSKAFGITGGGITECVVCVFILFGVWFSLFFFQGVQKKKTHTGQGYGIYYTPIGILFFVSVFFRSGEGRLQERENGLE
ncbi:hypothetical protein QBC38DRAFT_478535 [Podospora fimiseda]|uniref:Uncharacterized protein n=1 Tax=Podospora fimiseda TaxID=252190 RepID=A0AAN7BPJ8_9PEZI|nr:hypothetical protein QBC38DRAFT_478535 [Podospora fimiseda]